MTSEVEKSESLRYFLTTKGLGEKFDLEVKRRNPKSFQNKRYDSIIGSFRFVETEDGPRFWESVNDEFEYSAGS